MDERYHSTSSRAASEFWPRVAIFRDALAVDALRRVLERSITGRRDDRGFRVWVPGCGGGELVYAVAALVRDVLGRNEAPLSPRIFATDHDALALRRARRGWYPHSIAGSITPDLLDHHFERDEDGLRASPALRDMCIFAQHDLRCDPPLHRLDLVVCGDLPGALEPDSVDRLFRLFRFALRPGGMFVTDPALNLADEHSYVPELPEIGVFRARADRPLEPLLPPLDRDVEPRPPRGILDDVRHLVPADDEDIETSAIVQRLVQAIEEAQSRSEQLACANEEMLCSQEEARSANEDLAAANLELQAKIEEIDRLRSDLDNLLQSTQIPTVFLDHEGGIEWFSPTATQVLRVIDSDVGRPLGDLKPLVEGADLVAEAQAVLRDGSPRDVAVEHRRANGSRETRYWRVRMLPHRRPRASTGGVVMSFLDVTELELATRSLQRQARQQRAIAGLGVLALGSPIEQLFERTVEVVQRTLSLPCCEILTFDPMSNKLSLAASVGWPHAPVAEDAGPGTTADAELAHRDPSVAPATAPHLVRAGISRTLTASFRDVSSVYGLLRAHATDTVAFGPDEIAFASAVSSILGSAIGRHRTAQQLQEQARHKDEFLAMLGHELRNPLAAIANASELQDEAENDNPLLTKTTTVIRRQVTQMVRIVDDLLDVARFARGKVVLDREAIDLGALVRSAVEDHDGLARSGLDVELVMSAQPIVVAGDHERLLQVLNNLLTNAVQFTDPPGTITISLTGHDGFAEVRVADTGCGIEPEFLAHLFEPFRQAPQTLARKRGGLGLGLALVEQIVVQLGGSVHAESPGTGRGATFCLRLPRVQTQPTVHEERHESASSLRILVIEDNEDVATMLAGMLELAGHEVTVAYDARAGLEAARHHDLDVVLCDLGLPGDLDGFGVAENLRRSELREKPALISISGYGRNEDVERAHRAGFDRHLVKPVEFADLQRAIGDALHQRSVSPPA